MGSFDYTCALSELSIHSGQEAYLVPLVATGLGLNGGAFSRFSMAFPPMLGRYDDYGFVDELRPTPLHEAFAREMGHLGAASFCEKLREGGAVVETWRGEREVRFALARKDAWDAMLEMPSPWRESGAPGLTTREVAAAGASIGAGLYFDRAAKAMAELDMPRLEARIDAGSYDKRRLAVMLLNSAILEGVPEDDPFASFYGRRLASTSMDEIFAGASFAQVITRMACEGASREVLEEGLWSFGSALACSYNMHAVRKVWIDRDSSGPQCGELAMHWIWSQRLARIVDDEIDWTGDEVYLEAFAEARSMRESLVLGSAVPVPHPAEAAKKPARGL